MRPLILTYTGKQVNPLDLRPEDIDIRDIAHALANCNRFAGHAHRPITVAQHSVYVSRLVEESHGQAFQRQALFHDASEAYLGDVTKWLKHTPEFTAYREAENRVQDQINRHFDCHLVTDRWTARADKLMLRFEGEMAFGYEVWKLWLERLPPDYTFITQEENTRIGPWGFWSWREAEQLFLDRARYLGVEVPPPFERKPGALRRPGTGTRVRPSGRQTG